jgi:hypothetical protein
VASGWYAAALTMRLIVDGELRPAGGILGVGFDELSWPCPVRPGDELHAESEVLEVRPSKSRPDRGLIRVRTRTLNQKGEAVQIYAGNLLVPRQPAAAGVCLGNKPIMARRPTQGKPPWSLWARGGACLIWCMISHKSLCKLIALDMSAYPPTYGLCTFTAVRT